MKSLLGIWSEHTGDAAVLEFEWGGEYFKGRVPVSQTEWHALHTALERLRAGTIAP